MFEIGSLWNFRGRCSRVIDGDTVELEFVDQGFGDFKFTTPEHKLRFRLAGVNVYETSLRYGTTPEQKQLGLEAKEWLKNLIEGELVMVHTMRSGNLGRFICFLFENVPDDDRRLLVENSINKQLLDLQWGVVSKYPDGDIFIERGYSRPVGMP